MSRLLKFLLVLAVLAAMLGLSAVLVLQLPTFGGPILGEHLARLRQSPQLVNGRFENTPPYVNELALMQNLRDYSGGQQRAPGFRIPVLPMAPGSLLAPAQSGMRVIWFGHSSVLVEIDGVRIMTDPVLSERASPFQFLGPQRLHPPPIALAQLAGIDAVVISHDHYDHLDVDTIRQLAAGGTHFFAGLGIGAHLLRWQVPALQIHEMDWWDKASFKGMEIHNTPARHYSGRKSMDNSTLWSSWMLKGSGYAVYYSGDTGYGPHFGAIRERLGAPDIALMKVGAYGNSWLGIHMDPEAAVQAHLDLGAKVMLPVHWATFNLSYHAWNEPILRSLAAARAKGVELVTPRVGEAVEFGRPFANQAWYLPER